ncbi:hypothetical protein AAC387_Pa02g1782 [Persea americana]
MERKKGSEAGKEIGSGQIMPERSSLPRTTLGEEGNSMYSSHRFKQSLTLNQAISRTIQKGTMLRPPVPSRFSWKIFLEDSVKNQNHHGKLGWIFEDGEALGVSLATFAFKECIQVMRCNMAGFLKDEVEDISQIVAWFEDSWARCQKESSK